MRLIDAGHLYDEVEKLKESPWFNDDTNGARIIRREALNIVEDLCICKAPTVCDIERIRAEIAEIAPLDYPCDKRTPEHIRDMALEIIDRYAEPISIEKIRAEIEHAKDRLHPTWSEGARAQYDAFSWCISLIDRCAGQEPCDDAISRQAVLDIVSDMRGLARADVLADAIKRIEQLPSVRPQEPCDDAISRKSLKNKLQEQHDFFVNAYGGFSNLPQSDKARVDEMTNCIAMVVNEPPITPQQKMSKNDGIPEQWQELKETITEMRDNDGTGTQQEVCKFLVNYMDVLEKQMVEQEPKTGHWIRQGNTKEPLYGWYFCSECNSVIGDKTKYCSNCGCRMVEPQESEDKE